LRPAGVSSYRKVSRSRLRGSLTIWLDAKKKKRFFRLEAEALGLKKQ
jgi:hypothetical protein